MSMTDFAFLHGGGQGGWVWAETIAALHTQTGGAFGRALALDAPGCGEKRGRDTQGISVDDITDELLGDIERAGFKDVVLVGHSQAGTMLPLMVEKRPELFRRVVYVSCVAPRGGQTIPQTMGAGLRGANPDEVGWAVDPATHSMEERYAVMFCNDMSAPERDAFLSKLGKDGWPMSCYAETKWRYDHLDRTPASYVVCLKDQSLPAAWQEIFAQRVHATRLVAIDAGHQAMNTRPHALAEILRAEAT